jgi:hypothetical protein
MATANANAQTTTSTARAISRLGAVKRGVIRAPKRYVIYGAEGTGKSTLAASAPSPIFLDVEGGSEALNVARYPFDDGPDGHVPKSFRDVLAAIADLTESEHPYRTLVIDTADRLEGLIWAHLIEKSNESSAMSRKDGVVESIEGFGYGKGYVMAVDEWRALCVKLDRLRFAKGMQIVLLAHAQIKNFKNPEGPDFDRWIPGLNIQASGFLKSWSDITARLCHEETTTEKRSKFDKVKGLSTGVRLLKLTHSAAFDAKSRLALPEEVEIDIANPWQPFADAVAAARSGDLGALETKIKAELERIGDEEITAKATAAVKEAMTMKDSDRMQRFLGTLQARPAKEVA